MIQVGRTHLHTAEREDELHRLTAAFASHHVVRLPGFLADDLLHTIDAGLSAAPFYTRVEDGHEIEETTDAPTLIGLFTLVLNDARLFSLVDQLTGCGPIGCFTGRLYRRRQSRHPGDHYYPWHNDVSDDRLIALSINLGAEPHTGGLLQLRDAQSHHPIADMANTGHGDALLFRVSDALEHQVTPVEGAVPRTVMAGWFRRQPTFQAFRR